MPPQKDSTTGLSYGSPTVPSEGESPALRARSVKDQEVELRPVVAVDHCSGQGAVVATRVDGHADCRRGGSVLRCRVSIDQPTTRRDQVSMTTQRSSLPSWVGCSVMSVTHSWLGPSRAKLRWTRSVMLTPVQHGLGTTAKRQSNQARAPHQQRDGVATHNDAVVIDELGMDPDTSRRSRARPGARCQSGRSARHVGLIGPKVAC